MFLHGHGLNAEERLLLKRLIATWKLYWKPIQSGQTQEEEYIQVTERIAEIMCHEVIAQEHRIPEHVDEVFERIDMELTGRLNQEDRRSSMMELRNLVEKNLNTTKQ
ncbi:MAG: hypothetical protein NWE83_07170 [Candidatus Bathyarchaeota archaeon]|nr:hypothetical protein [Candidatus Bathyarchaeota archaeon]